MITRYKIHPSRAITAPRQRVLTRKAMICDVDALVPEFFALYTEFICKSPERCYDGSIYIPQAPQQLEIVRTMRGLLALYPIDGYEGLILKAILDDNQEAFDQLMAALIQMHDAQEKIQQLVNVLT